MNNNVIENIVCLEKNIAYMEMNISIYQTAVERSKQALADLKKTLGQSEQGSGLVHLELHRNITRQAQKHGQI